MPSKKRKTAKSLSATILDILEDMKAIDIVCLDVGHLTSITDHMIVASGRSERHVRAIAEALIERTKAAGFAPLGVEGTAGGEWILVDFADAIVHVMQPKTREFYQIERLWDISAPAEDVVES
jgi:ribosome-associated protein